MRDGMKRHWMPRAVKIAALALVAVPVFVAVFGSIVMLLWNWLLPPLFGWSPIGFWQALGLLLLCRILLGGFHGGHGGHRAWRHRMMDRWERMTPEEREKLRAGLRAHCCRSETPGPESAV
jgi:ABC-type dipeptide/oligopeptide/nickel transport system permease component